MKQPLIISLNIRIHYVGLGTEEDAKREVPELETAYPDPDLFGTIPSWGIFARHVKNLQIRGVELRVAKSDARPAVTLEDAQGVRFTDTVLAGPDGSAGWSLKEVSGFRVRDVAGLPEGEMAEVKEKTQR